MYDKNPDFFATYFIPYIKKLQNPTANKDMEKKVPMNVIVSIDTTMFKKLASKSDDTTSHEICYALTQKLYFINLLKKIIEDYAPYGFEIKDYLNFNSNKLPQEERYRLFEFLFCLHSHYLSDSKTKCGFYDKIIQCILRFTLKITAFDEFIDGFIKYFENKNSCYDKDSLTNMVNYFLTVLYKQE